ncbi:hypothetical protein NP493_410g06000 [Ridgeia piscesae]|uniref:Uncharacterized protein n=1 Tax=Ridgeia piscesae TaxID=27915 RepID=A0AAD9L0K7_RIDPI|nr:hypothetical protein NP493_410g06000 [Ridgeia piscesae]
MTKSFMNQTHMGGYYRVDSGLRPIMEDNNGTAQFDVDYDDDDEEGEAESTFDYSQPPYRCRRMP